MHRIFQKNVLCCTLGRSPAETKRQILDSQLLNRIAGKSTTVIYPDGNRAWESLCLHIKTNNSLESMKRNQKRKSILAGAQCRDRSWKSLKVQWMCSGVNATTKENGHTLLSPVVSPLVHQWAWRQSIGPKKPKEFLQELEHLLKRSKIGEKRHAAYRSEKMSSKNQGAQNQRMHFGPRPAVRRVPSWL